MTSQNELNSIRRTLQLMREENRRLRSNEAEKSLLQLLPPLQKHKHFQTDEAIQSELMTLLTQIDQIKANPTLISIGEKSNNREISVPSITYLEKQRVKVVALQERMEKLRKKIMERKAVKSRNGTFDCFFSL